MMINHLASATGVEDSGDESQPGASSVGGLAVRATDWLRRAGCELGKAACSQLGRVPCHATPKPLRMEFAFLLNKIRASPRLSKVPLRPLLLITSEQLPIPAV